ncbi:FxsA family protein [Thiopseudomonas denitrificans]|uniref:UPF0716 protein FxsA n=1 Tax=Thiopseudomonas denitrificans TaxID=1501432 RepID=A0A4V3D5A6_9GAMM|nr:FxsA family protein [Thiopseudomonas denitrificans]TDQ39347.1 UPF0716 protein FxsA [Thiopseudomonas denitrificans]
MQGFLWFFLLLPLLELYVLIKVGSEIGALSVVLWIIFSAIAGIFCIRMAGVATAFSVRERMARGEVPDDAMLTGLLWVIGGVLLFIPGFISDAAGVLCILPVTRYWLIRRMRRGMPQADIRAGYGEYRQSRTQGSHDEREVHIIEGEYERKDKD